MNDPLHFPPPPLDQEPPLPHRQTTRTQEGEGTREGTRQHRSLWQVCREREREVRNVKGRKGGKERRREGGKEGENLFKYEPENTWLVPTIDCWNKISHTSPRQTRHKQTTNPAVRQRPVPPSKQGVQKERARSSYSNAKGAGEGAVGGGGR